MFGENGILLIDKSLMMEDAVMNIALCDDAPIQMSAIETYLLERDSKVHIDVYFSGEALLKAYDEGVRYQAVFLDMEMGDKNGLETADALRAMDDYIEIIFVTGYRQYMEDSFKCSPFRFLVKPIKQDKLEEAVNALYQKLAKKPTSLVVKEKGNVFRLYSDEIVYCESDGHLIYIHTKECVYTVRMTMSALLEKVGEKDFGRPHQSYLVNFRYVRSITQNEVVLSIKQQILPLSRSYKKFFKEQYINYMERSLCV